jgi:hypothetical protein
MDRDYHLNHHFSSGNDSRPFLTPVLLTGGLGVAMIPETGFCVQDLELIAKAAKPEEQANPVEYLSL